MPIADKFKVSAACSAREVVTCILCSQDMGTVVMGKVESGSVCKGSQFFVMPNRVSASECVSIF